MVAMEVGDKYMAYAHYPHAVAGHLYLRALATVYQIEALVMVEQLRRLVPAIGKRGRGRP